MNGRRALTLVEILVCLVVLGVLAVPLFDTFSTSKGMAVSARSRTTAMHLASSYLACLADLPRNDLPETSLTDDRALTGVLALDRLGLAPPPAGYRRQVTIVRLPLPAGEKPLYHASVTVTWRSPVSHRPLEFSLDRLLPSP